MPDARPPAFPLSRDGSESQGTQPSGVCLNCGFDLVDEFCARCGQKNEPLRQPVRHFIVETFDELFGLDGRIWRTLKELMIPGRLTQEYLAGRRVTYLRPLRLYLTASISFFFLLAVLDPVGTTIEREIAGADSTIAVRDHLAVIDSTRAAMHLEREQEVRHVDSLQQVVGELRGDSLALSMDGARPPGLDEAEEALEEAEEELEESSDHASRQRLRQLEWQYALLATWPSDSLIHSEDLDAVAERLFPTSSVNVDLPAWMQTSSSMNRLIRARTSEEQVSAVVDLVRDAMGHLPTVMFLLLPVFAVLLKLVYIRRRWYYTEHLVFALHTHAFAFFIFVLMAVLLGFSGDTGWPRQVSWVLSLTIPLYFYAAQKRVYGQGWLRTALKALILGWLYVTLLVGLGVALAFVLVAILG